MSNVWAKNPDLFIYTKRNDVYLWRCNKTTWMPLLSRDFDVVGKITDHQALMGDDSLFNWDKKYYDDMLSYISPRRLLVNNRGLVIMELRKFGQDGKLDQNNEQPFYIRSLDVLSLQTYNLRDRTIPSKTVQYLEGEGRAATVEDTTVPTGTGTTTTTTTTTTTSIDGDDQKKWDEKREALEKQVSELTTANENLKSEKEAAEKQASDLNDRNKTLSEDFAAQKSATQKAQQERDDAKKDKDAAEKKAIDLQTQIDTLNKKEVWMNDSQPGSNWIGFQGLRNYTFANYPIQVDIKSKGSNLLQLQTNVHPRYIYRLDINKHPYAYAAVIIEDLIPNQEKARFNQDAGWASFKQNGTTYVVCTDPRKFVTIFK